MAVAAGRHRLPSRVEAARDLGLVAVPAGMRVCRLDLVGHAATVVLSDAVEHLCHGAWAVLAEYEAALDPAVAGSDLGRTARRTGPTCPLGPIALGAVDTALRAARDTAGAYDPTRHPGGAAAGAWRAVSLRQHPASVALPAAVRLDLGALGTGLIVDAAAHWLERRGVGSALVQVDGCLRAVGEAPAGGWRLRQGAGGRPFRLRSGAICAAALPADSGAGALLRPVWQTTAARAAVRWEVTSRVGAWRARAVLRRPAASV